MAGNGRNTVGRFFKNLNRAVRSRGTRVRAPEARRALIHQKHLRHALSPQQGLTLVELITSIVIISLIASAAAALLSVCLQAHDYGIAKSALYQEGTLLMERMTAGVRTSTHVLIPNAHTTTRSVLAISGTVNNDSDFYFGDVLFPRIDEDPPSDLNADSAAGIDGYDDDGDSSTDEGAAADNDEDGRSGEDKVDGIDNDGDGIIDEDYTDDTNADGAAGIADMDDDGDGATDEGAAGDDDEDGALSEDPLDPILYTYDSGAGTLSEVYPGGGQTVVLSNNVTAFEVLYEVPDATHDSRLSITLTLTLPGGEKVTFTEQVFPRNVVQKWGRRVL